jgi:hypothetical protein
MLGKPAEHLLRCICSYQHLGGAGERDPFPEVWPQSCGLPTAAEAISNVSVAPFMLVRSTGGDEAETLQDPASLMGGEIGPVEPRCACDYLLGRETAPTYDDVVLVYRVRQAVQQALLDPARLELEPVS